MAKPNTLTAFAPATSANIAVGFDYLGLAINCIGDKVTVNRVDQPIVTISSITCEDYIDSEIVNAIPKSPENNTCTAGLLRLIQDLRLPFGFDLKIHKGIPLGSGLGGSSASAVAAIVAANGLLDQPLLKEKLLAYAVDGEAVASGARHADNVAPSLFGGLTLVAPDMKTIRQIPFPNDLRIVVVYPGFRLDTKTAREVLPPNVALTTHVKASSRFANFIASCFLNDIELMRESLVDDIIEPPRSHLIWGFHEVKKIAFQAGAIASSISGAGPTVFAIAPKEKAEAVKKVMASTFIENGLEKTLSWVSEINFDGAHLIK
jgi:homoserine kinase